MNPDDDQGSDAPCKKLRTMFPTGHRESEEDEGNARDLLNDQELGSGVEILGPDGDRIRSNTVGQSDVKADIDTGSVTPEDHHHHHHQQSCCPLCRRSDCVCIDSVNSAPESDQADTQSVVDWLKIGACSSTRRYVLSTIGSGGKRPPGPTGSEYSVSSCRQTDIEAETGMCYSTEAGMCAESETDADTNSFRITSAGDGAETGFCTEHGISTQPSTTSDTESGFSTEPGISTQPCLSTQPNTTSDTSLSKATCSGTNNEVVHMQVEKKSSSRSQTNSQRFSFLQSSAAMAENAYIKNKENRKLSGDDSDTRSNFSLTTSANRTRDQLPAVSTPSELSPKASTSFAQSQIVSTSSIERSPVASTSSSQNLCDSDNTPRRSERSEPEKVIAFDRADFEFDFYGAPSRQEEDGSVITPPERMADTGFIEMFSNSVMGSVLRPQAGEMSTGFSTRDSQETTSSRPSPSTGYPSSCLPGGDYKPVKPANVPFHLDPTYIHTIIRQHNINSLPQTLLVKVFKLLAPYTLLRKVGLVCKYWYNVCRDPEIWRDINLRNQYRLSDATLVQLLGFSDRVLGVNLTDCRFVTDAGIRRLILKCQHLQSLKLMRCFDLTDSSFAGMGSWHLGANLHTLYLDGCCRLTDNTVIEIAESCPSLSSLHLNQCSKVSDAGVISLAQHCRGLKQLLLDHCSKVTDKGVGELVLGCPGISYLNIMSCGVTDTGIKMLSKLANLTNLDVSNIPLMTPAAIVYVSRYCKKLDCINVSLNSIIDDACVAEVVKNLPGLLRFYCVSCSVTDKGLEKIAEYRPTLTSLDVGWCQDVTDHGVRVISLACPHLDYFGLIRCDKVTLETIEELVLRFPNVNYSTFILESRRLLERARKEGYQFGL